MNNDFDKMRIFFSKINWKNEFQGLDVNQMYKKLIDLYQTALYKFTPKFVRSNVRSTKKIYPKWFKVKLKKEIKLVQHPA